MQNDAQHHLDQKAAIISAWSSKNLHKVEYLTGKDLGLKPNTIEKARFAMGKIFNKGLSEDDKKERLFKRLENIKNKNEQQLQAIKDQREKQLKELENIDKNKTLKAIDEISIKKKKKMMKQVNYCLNLIKSIKHLIKQNLFVQKLMGLNMTLIVFCFH